MLMILLRINWPNFALLFKPWERQNFRPRQRGRDRLVTLPRLKKQLDVTYALVVSSKGLLSISMDQFMNSMLKDNTDAAFTKINNDGQDTQILINFYKYILKKWNKNLKSILNQKL